MTAEQLNIKMKLDMSDVKAGIDKVKKGFAGMNDEIKRSLPKISSEGKKAKNSLEDVSEASDDVKQSLQKVGNEATTSLSKIKQMVAGIRSGGGLNESFKIDASGTEAAGASLEELEGTMNAIMGLNFLELFSSHTDKIKDIIAFSGEWKETVEAVNGVIKGAKNEVKSLEKDYKALKKSTNMSKEQQKLFTDQIKKGKKEAFQLKLAMSKLGFSRAVAQGKELLAVLKSVASLAATAALILAPVVGVLSSMGISKLGKEVYDNAQMAGMSSVNYQKWAFQLERAGIQAEELREIVKTLTEAQVDVINGEEDMIAAFQQLGISQQEVINMNQQQLFERTVAGLQGIENQTQRTAIAYKLFSEDATKLTQILNMSSRDAAILAQNYYQLGGGMSYNLIQLSAQAQHAMYNLRTAFMGIRNALAEALLPAIITVVTWLTKALAVIGMFLRAIFGIDISKSSGGGGIAGGFTTGAVAAEDYTGAVQEATKAVEKFRRATMGFDELNVLPGKDSTAGAAGGGGANTPSISTPDYGAGFGASDPLVPVEDLGLDKIQAWVEKYKTAIKDVTAIALSLIGAGMIVAGFFGGFNIPMMLKGAALLGIGIAIGSGEGGTWDRIGDKFKEWWASFKGWFKEHVLPIFTKAYWAEKWDTVKNATSEKLSAIGNAISTKWDGIKGWFKEHVAPKFTKAYWAEKFDTIRASANEKLDAAKNAISTKWTGVKNWFKENVAPKFTKKYWSDKWDTIRSGASEKLDATKTAISTKWTGVKNWFKESVSPKFTKKYWTDKFDSIKSGASDKVGAAVTVCKDKWNGLKKWFKDSVAPKFTTSYWKGKFDSIKSGAKSAFNGVISVVESAVNGIIRKINTLSWKIPNWVPKFGGERFGFNFKTISIPRLATGGIATSSTLANIGERGAEAVLPLTGSQSNAWMDMLANKIAERSNSGTPAKIILNVDGRQLGWAAIDNINNITKQSGNLQLVLG